jgi:hypothetical protein
VREELAPTAGSTGSLGSEQCMTRAGALARGGMAAGALASGVALIAGLPRMAASKPSRAQDAKALDFLLRVEYLQAGFYTEAEERGVLKGELREFASVVGKQERAHIAALEQELAGQARKEPVLDFRNATTDPRSFIETAVQLEEIAVAAFNGQAPNLTKARLLTVLRIVSVEARHVGWARDLAGRNPAPRPADLPATATRTMAAIAKTGFME